MELRPKRARSASVPLPVAAHAAPPAPAMLGHRVAGDVGANLLRRPITAQMLQARIAGLRRVDALAVAGDLPAITMHRGADHAGDYADLLADTRASISRLRQGATGRSLLSGLQQRSDAMQAHLPAPARQSIVRIQSARYRPGGNAQAPNVPNLVAARAAYRYDGQAGAGAASNVHYDEREARGHRFIGLGHELVHAYRAAHGIGVSPIAASPRSGDAILNPPTHPVVRNVLDNRAQLREEFETVGLTPTPQNVWQQRMAAAPPTENALRAEHQIPARPHYSGVAPGTDNQAVANVDAATDTAWRWPWTPSPVQQILRHLGA
jgi:Effector protein